MQILMLLGTALALERIYRVQLLIQKRRESKCFTLFVVLCLISMYKTDLFTLCICNIW